MKLDLSARETFHWLANTNPAEPIRTETYPHTFKGEEKKNVPKIAIRIDSVFARDVPTAKFFILTTLIRQTVAKIWAILARAPNRKNFPFIPNSRGS